MRILGLDYGARRIGVALGDTETKMASPWAVIESDDRLDVLRRIHELVEREGVGLLVVGVPKPLRHRDEENAQVVTVRAFIANLRAQGLNVEETDEVMSSGVAAAHMRERGEKGKRDDLAAMTILQGWLDGRA